MDGKSFALICVLLIAAACVHNSDAFWGRRRRRSAYCSCSCSAGWFHVGCGCGCSSGKRSAGEDTATECLPVRIEVFDCNDDGKVSYHEFVVALLLDEEAASSHEAFQSWDSNGDNFLSEEELRNDPFNLESSGCRQSLHNHERTSLSGQLPGNFDVYDADQNGLIDKDEFKAVVEELYGEGPMEKLDNIVQKLSRCDGEIDREDFDLAVGVSAPWLFKMGLGEEKADQIAVEDQTYEDIKNDEVGEEEILEEGTKRRRDTDLAEKQ